jgi:predicted nucleic acid-binding protein
MIRSYAGGFSAHVLERFRRVSIGDVGISSITAAELAFGVIKSGSERNRRYQANKRTV